MRLTDKEVTRLAKAIPTEKNALYWDDKLIGLGLKVTPHGLTSFVLNYYLHGKERRITIGRWPQWTAEAARRKASTYRHDIDEFKDPLLKRREEREAKTLSDLFESYFQDTETLKLRPNTLRSYKGIAKSIFGWIDPTDDTKKPKKKELLIGQHLLKKPLKGITQSDVSQLHAKKKGKPYQANRMLALLSAVFTFALHEDRKWVERNPAQRRRKGKAGGIAAHTEHKRKRYLKPVEMERLHQALDAYVAAHAGTRYAEQAKDAVRALRLILYTGCRLQEALQATGEEFDLERGTWTKPSHHTKTKIEEETPLTPPALDLLESFAPTQGPLFVGRGNHAARVTLRRPWTYATKAAGLKGVRLHDLRHSFASAAISNKVPLAVVGKLLGHTQASTTMRYAHLQESALREGANMVGKVLEFKRA